MKKKITLLYTGVITVCLLCLIGAAFLVRSSVDELGLGSLFPTTTPPIVDPELKLYYQVPKNPTEIQKTYYDELIDLTQGYPEGEFDPYAISKSVVKNFVCDFYTWTNKDGNFDVGGLDLLYGPHHMTFALYARDTYYQNFNHFENEFGVENLMEVADVQITGEAYGGIVKLDEVEMHSYYLEAAWTYKDGSLMDTQQLQNKASFTVLENKNSGRFEIIRILDLDVE